MIITAKSCVFLIYQVIKQVNINLILYYVIYILDIVALEELR